MNEEKGMKMSYWLVALTAMGTAIASIGGYVALSDYLAARPSVSADLVGVALVPSKLSPTTVTGILDRLSEIENNKIRSVERIRGLSSALRYGRDTGTLDQFLEELDAVISFFEKRRKLVVDLNEIQNSNPTNRETLLTRLDEVETEHKQVTRDYVLRLMNRLREGRTDVEYHRMSLLNLVEQYGNIQALEDLISDLQQLKHDFSPTETQKKYPSYLRVDVTFVNRSRHGNAIVTKATIQVSHGENVHPIDLYISDGGGELFRHSIARVLFHSEPIHEFSVKRREFLADMNKEPEDFQCEVVVLDMYGNTWSTGKENCRATTTMHIRKP